MLRFGCATRDITPDRPVWLGGYAGRNGPSTGVSEPILAGCIALQTGEGQAAGGEPALLVTLDLVGVHDAGARALAGRIAEATGVPVERICWPARTPTTRRRWDCSASTTRTWDATASSTRTPPTWAR